MTPSRDRWMELVLPLFRARDSAAVFAAAVRAIPPITGASSAAVLRRRGTELHVVEVDALGPFRKGRAFPLDGDLAGQALLGGVPVRVPDVEADPRPAAGPYRDTDVRTLAVAPVPGTEEAVAAYWTEPGAAGEGHVETLRRLAEATASALENARIFESLAEQQRFTQRLFHTSPEAIYVYDLLERRSVFASRSVGELLEYSPEEILEMKDQVLPRLLHPDDFQRIVPYLAAFGEAREGEVREFEYRMKHRDGSWRWFRSRDAVFRRESDGRVRQIIGSATDVTERRAATEALQAQRDELATYHGLVAHDVANLGSALQNVVDQLRTESAGPLTPRQAELVRRAARQAYELNRLSANALLLARIREKGLPPPVAPVPLRELVRHAAETVRSVHFDRPFRLEVEDPEALAVPGLPFLENLLLNLVDNAVRHRNAEAPGVVRVRASSEGGRAVLRVQGGSAVESGALPVLFDRASRKPEAGGHGLGLALAREILERSGGGVSAVNVATPEGDVLEIALRFPSPGA